jgi:hypothetical protein
MSESTSWRLAYGYILDTIRDGFLFDGRVFRYAAAQPHWSNQSELMA